MFSAIKNLVSPKMIQIINISIYDSIKVSLLMGIFSFPWALINLFVKFTPTTFILYAIGFIVFIPNIIVGITLLDKPEEINVKSYFREWKHSWKRYAGLSFGIVGVLAFLIADSFIVIEQMKVSFIFPIMYITLMFVAITAIYLLVFKVDSSVISSTSILQQVKNAAFLSWRFAGTTLLAFLIVMLWFSISYFLQGVALVFGNGIAWMTISKLLMKKIQKVTTKA